MFSIFPQGFLLQILHCLHMAELLIKAGYFRAFSPDALPLYF